MTEPTPEYVQGFMQKCAAYGLDAEATAALIKFAGRGRMALRLAKQLRAQALRVKNPAAFQLSEKILGGTAMGIGQRGKIKGGLDAWSLGRGLDNSIGNAYIPHDLTRMVQQGRSSLKNVSQMPTFQPPPPKPFFKRMFGG
jgi:hypothetical protein